jgi:hypothetical protein
VETGEGELEHGEHAVEVGVETSEAGVDDSVAPCNGLGLGEDAPLGEEGVDSCVQTPPSTRGVARSSAHGGGAACAGCPISASSWRWGPTCPSACGGVTARAGRPASNSSPLLG